MLLFNPYLLKTLNLSWGSVDERHYESGPGFRTAPHGDKSRTLQRRVAAYSEQQLFVFLVTPRRVRVYFFEAELRRASSQTGEHQRTKNPALTWRERH